MAQRYLGLLAASLLLAPAASAQNLTNTATSQSVLYANVTSTAAALPQSSPNQGTGVSGQSITYPYTSTVVVGAATYTITQQNPLSVVTQAPGSAANVPVQVAGSAGNLQGQAISGLCPVVGLTSSIQYVAFEQVATAVGQVIKFSTQVTNYSPASPTPISAAIAAVNSGAAKTVSIVSGLVVETVNGVVLSINGQPMTQANAVIVVDQVTIVIQLGVIVTVNGQAPVVTDSTTVSPNGSNVDANSGKISTVPSASTPSMSMLYSNTTSTSGFQTSTLPTTTASLPLTTSSAANNSSGFGLDSADRSRSDSASVTSTSTGSSTSTSSVPTASSTDSSSSTSFTTEPSTTTSLSSSETTSTQATTTSFTTTTSSQTSSSTTSAPQPTQFVVNPSFENVDSNDDATYAPWTFDQVFLFDASQEPAHTGDYSAFPRFDVYGPHVLSQTITGLTAGEPYSLEYWFIRWAGGADSCTMQVTFDGQTVDSLDNDDFTAATAYTVRELIVTPSDTSAVLSISGGCTVGYDSVNIALDDITLTSI